MIEDGIVTLACGRNIGFARYGDPDGRPIGYCHGLPSSRLEARLACQTARRLGLQLIAIDRPGYGRSDPLPPARIGAWPDDLARVADQKKATTLSRSIMPAPFLPLASRKTSVSPIFPSGQRKALIYG